MRDQARVCFEFEIAWYVGDSDLKSVFSAKFPFD
jgi:hypothetical protein